MEEHQCCEEIQESGGWYSHRCTRKGTVEIDGKWYCWQHDPERVKRLRKEEQEKFDRKNQAHKERDHRQRLEQDVCQGVSTEELEKLGTSGLRMLLHEYRRWGNG